MNSPPESGSPSPIVLPLFRRIVLWSIIILAILAVLWTGFCLEERWRGKRAWNAYRSAALSRGAKVGIAEIAGKPIPDSQNFAAVPMVRDLFRAPSDPAYKTKWFSALRMEGYREATLRKSPDLVTWRDYFLRQKIIAEGSESPATDILRALRTVEPELEQLREAGRRPHSRFPVGWNAG